MSPGWMACFTPPETSTSISPDIEIEQELPEELKAAAARQGDRGEASLRGHLKNEGIEQETSGSSSYVPKEKEKDLQLKAAIDLLHGKEVKSNKKVTEAEPKTDGTGQNVVKAKPPEVETAPGTTNN